MLRIGNYSTYEYYDKSVLLYSGRLDGVELEYSSGG